MPDIRNIVVTGGCGFIGSNFVRWTAEHRPGVRMTVLDKLTYAGNPANVEGVPGVELVVGDVCDAALLSEVVPGHDAVVHFAAESHNDNSIATRNPSSDQRRGHLPPARGVQGSTARGSTTSRPTRSTGTSRSTTRRASPRRRPTARAAPTAPPRRPRTCSCAPGTAPTGVRATISNCSNNYGPRQHVEKFIPRQITSILRGGRPRLYGDGANVRDWIHVDDHSSAVWAVLERGRAGETYLVGADGERSNLEVLRAILEVMGRPGDDFDRVRDRPGPRPPLRHRRLQDTPGAGLAPRAHRLLRGAGPDRRVVPGQRGVVVGGQGRRRGALRRAGDVGEEWAWREEKGWSRAASRLLKPPSRGVVVVDVQRHGDVRGCFMETYKRPDFEAGGIACEFVQDNQSFSSRGVLRGLHFQVAHPQAKLVRVVRGEVFDVCVDLRPGSPTYGKWEGAVLRRTTVGSCSCRGASRTASSCFPTGRSSATSATTCTIPTTRAAWLGTIRTSASSGPLFRGTRRSIRRRSS